MRINASTHAATEAVRNHTTRPKATSSSADDAELRKVFHSFAGEVLFAQMLKAMRKTVGKPAYFHGGRAEELFQHQLDQVLAEKLGEASGETFGEPMSELLRLPRG
ncbi:MAG: hypothetical protein A2V70_03035 [Planctomycetes bacterium RBG_13_63_9]|nr:MAG: hypothetical protein A2V70_03035 [Planctomycetes bacterium RBG_13_63_9]